MIFAYGTVLTICGMCILVGLPSYYDLFVRSVA